MRIRVLGFWFWLRASYWFVPALMAVLAVGLATLTLTLDRRLGSAGVRALSWTYAGGPEGARAVLSTIAGSMITVAGLTFSVTMVALSLASSQFGPRLLMNYMRDTGNQVVLGTFVATFLYCLVVLRTVSGDGDLVLVPHLSVTVAVGLAVASLGVLIYFIHHAAVSIRVETVIASVVRDLLDAIDRLYPEEIGRDTPSRGDGAVQEVASRARAEARPVAASRSGYVRAIDGDALVELARGRDLIVVLDRRPGHFVVEGSPVARAWPGERLDDDVRSAIRAALVLGSERTPEQDVEFAVNQLVEVALRALSPGVNDPFTAIACVDHLGAALSRLARREMPSAFRLDGEGRLRVLATTVEFAGVAGAAFDQIRQAARGNAAVTVRLLETIAGLLEHARRPADRLALRRQAGMLHRGALEAVAEGWDRAAVEERFQAVGEQDDHRR
jgi:uncharacterized membrane protein